MKECLNLSSAKLIYGNLFLVILITMSEIKRKVFLDFKEDDKGSSLKNKIPDDVRPILFSSELVFAPPTDVWETEKEMYVMMEIAHLSSKDFSIQYRKGNLIIKGERKVSKNREKSDITKYHKKEIDYGKFLVKIKMNTRIVVKKIVAKYENGMLNIVLPKDFRQPEIAEFDIPVEII